jgi:hypothetical protein
MGVNAEGCQTIRRRRGVGTSPLTPSPAQRPRARHQDVKRDGAPKVCPGANLSLYIDSMKKKAGDFLAEIEAAEKELKTAEHLALHLPPSPNRVFRGH